MVVDHLALAAFATINVGYPKLCLNCVSRNQNIHTLRAHLVGKVIPGANALITQFDPTRSRKSWLNSPTMGGPRPNRLGFHR